MQQVAELHWVWPNWYQAEMQKAGAC